MTPAPRPGSCCPEGRRCENRDLSREVTLCGTAPRPDRLSLTQGRTGSGSAARVVTPFARGVSVHSLSYDSLVCPVPHASLGRMDIGRESRPLFTTMTLRVPPMRRRPSGGPLGAATGPGNLRRIRQGIAALIARSTADLLSPCRRLSDHLVRELRHPHSLLTSQREGEWTGLP